MKLLCSKCGAWNEGKPLATILQRCDKCSEVMATTNMGGPNMTDEQLSDGKTKQEVWVEKSSPIEVKVPGAVGSVVFEPRIFSSGSCGYGFSGKININGDKLQCSFNMVVVGSKDWGKAPEEVEKASKPTAKAKAK